MLYPDFEEFIESLNAHGVRYLIVGGHAFAYHARPRATKDLDVFLERTPVNARRTLKALSAFFGGATLSFKLEDLLNPQLVLQLGVAPVRIDLLSDIPGCPSFEVAWKNRVTAKFGDATANYLSYSHLMDAKKAAGRPQDLADLAVLERKVRARVAKPKSVTKTVPRKRPRPNSK